jgi:hypothetical protein
VIIAGPAVKRHADGDDADVGPFRDAARLAGEQIEAGERQQDEAAGDLEVGDGDGRSER